MKFNAMVPEADVSCFEKSLEFYQNLGFVVEYDRPASKFAYLSLGEAQLMICEAKKDGIWQTGPLEYPYGRGINFQITVPSLKSIFKRLKEHQISCFKGPYEVWYPVKDKLEGARELLVLDPDGYLLRFQEDLETRDNSEGLRTSRRVQINLGD